MIARFRFLLLAGIAVAAATVALPAGAETDGPIPRFEDALCPGVVGLKVEAAETLVGRFRANAEALGRRMAPPETCEANVVVAFVDDGQAVLGQMHREQSHAFAEMSPTERSALLAQQGPVHVLNRIFTRTRDGLPVYRRDSLTDLPQAVMWSAHSKIYAATRQDIVYSLVLIDRSAVRGLSVNQLADYATVRALVHSPPSAQETGGDSILALFDSTQATRPAELTSFDHALLGSLYYGIPNLNGTARAAQMAQATGQKAAPE
jgi:hypothetical protein